MEDGLCEWSQPRRNFHQNGSAQRRCPPAELPTLYISYTILASLSCWNPFHLTAHILKRRLCLWSAPWRIRGSGLNVQAKIPLLTSTAALNLLESNVCLTTTLTFNLCQTSLWLLNLVTGCMRSRYFYCARHRRHREKQQPWTPLLGHCSFPPRLIANGWGHDANT